MKLEADDRLQKDQDQQDHCVATEIADDDTARANDPRQTDEPEARGGARDPGDATHTTPASKDQKTIFFDIGADSPVAPGDDDMQDDKFSILH